MISRLACALAVSLTGQSAMAQTMMDRVKTAVSETSDIDIILDEAMSDIVPDFGDDPPHEIPNSAAGLEESGQLLAISDTPEGDRFTQFSEKTQEWGPTAIDANLLDTADAAVSDPESIVSGDLFSSTSSDGELCTVETIEEAPLFTRSCDRSATIGTRTCTNTAVVRTHIAQNYVCSNVVFGDLYFPCTVMESTPQCVELSYDECIATHGSDSHESCADPNGSHYLCTTDEPLVPLALPLLDSYEVEVLDWEETCTQEIDETACNLTSTSCPAGPTIEFINGVATPLECGETVEDYTCISSFYDSDCDVFTDGSCELLGSDCIFLAPDGACRTFEDTYECGSDTNGDFGASCEAVTVCIGDVCQTVETDTNEDFAVSIANVAMVNDMVENNDVTDESWLNYFFVNEDDLSLFNGDVKQCGRAIFGSVNCCKDTGWALGSLAMCNTQEIELYAAMEAGRTVYMNTYCSASFIVCTVKKRRYCVYGSKLARIISTEVFRVNDWEFECRGLTYDELQSVDFADLDLSELYGDMVADTSLPDPSALADALADNILATQPILEETYGE